MATNEKSKKDPKPKVRPCGPTPSREQRNAAKLRILEVVNSLAVQRIDEVFEMADWGDISWSDLNRVSDRICGGVASELEDDLVEYVLEILEDTIRPTPMALGKEGYSVQQKEQSVENDNEIQK